MDTRGHTLKLKAVPERPLLSDALTLAATKQAAARARELLSFRLADWGHADILDDAQLVISELAANAVQQTKDESGVIRVYIALMSKSIIVGVIDHAEGVPTLVEVPDENGRGLHIIDTLSLRWGYDQLKPESRGKLVWAELAI